jgi:hypothetical protein
MMKKLIVIFYFYYRKKFTKALLIPSCGLNAENIDKNDTFVVILSTRVLIASVTFFFPL